MTEQEKERFKGICCVELSGEGCAACVTLMPVLSKVIAARKDRKSVV